MDFNDNDGLGNADIGVLLQDLESYIEKCSRVPLTGKIMAEGDFILETIDKINAILPEEMKQAKQVLEQKNVGRRPRSGGKNCAGNGNCADGAAGGRKNYQRGQRLLRKHG